MCCVALGAVPSLANVFWIGRERVSALCVRSEHNGRWPEAVEAAP